MFFKLENHLENRFAHKFKTNLIKIQELSNKHFRWELSFFFYFLLLHRSSPTTMRNFLVIRPTLNGNGERVFTNTEFNIGEKLDRSSMWLRYLNLSNKQPSSRPASQPGQRSLNRSKHKSGAINLLCKVNILILNCSRNLDRTFRCASTFLVLHGRRRTNGNAVGASSFL